MAAYQPTPDFPTSTTPNSRKRPYEGDENAGQAYKNQKTGAEKPAGAVPHDPSNGAANHGNNYAPENDEEILLRVLAEPRHCGGLIGRGGATINAIREESGATVEVKNPIPYANKRIMCVKGPLSRVIKGTHLVLEQLAKTIVESMNRRAERTRRKSAAVQLAGSTEQKSSQDSNPDTISIEFTMLIPGQQIGAVIGKRGTHISETRSVSGTAIAVAAEYLPNSSEKTVAITGNHRAVAIAAERILRQVATCAEKGEAKYPYEPVPEDDKSAAAANHAAMFAGGPPSGGPYGGRGGGSGGSGGAPGGWNIGQRGRGGGGGQYGGGRGGGRPGGNHGGGGGPTSWNADPYSNQGGNNEWGVPAPGGAQGYDSGWGNNQGGGGGGGHHSNGGGGWGGNQGGPPSANRWNGGGGGGPGHSGHSSHGHGGGPSGPMGGRGGSSSGGGGPEVTVPFPVSKSLVGGVIGRGGQNITAIRARSGAKVRIEEAVDGSDERMITITGNGHQVKAAVTMIQYHLQHQ